MKCLLLFVAILCMGHASWSQITITAVDMPVSGDTLRYSIASPLGTSISPADSGANIAWCYSLTSTAQAVDTYKTAAQVNLLYVLTVGLSAFGYKVADSLPGLGAVLPVSIQQIYTFFEEQSSPSRYEAKAFAANISGLPTATNYTAPDVWYFFPLTYMSTDSAPYVLNITLPGIGSLKETGTRKSRVDGWGTIVTPYYTTPRNCIRVRSVINEVDSVKFGTFAIGLPRNTVEYKWLVNGEHYPALWVTSNVFGGTETITGITYRDKPTGDTTSAVNAVANVANGNNVLSAHPNPASNGIVTIDIPSEWKFYNVTLFDMQSRQVATFNNSNKFDISVLPAGNYIGRVLCGTIIKYVQIVR